MEFEKRSLRANLTPEAYRGWMVTARRYGASMTAILEVLGVRLDVADGRLPISAGMWDQIGEEARALDVDRRLRPRDIE